MNEFNEMMKRFDDERFEKFLAEMEAFNEWWEQHEL